MLNDYVLASPSLFKYILDFSILTTDISGPPLDFQGGGRSIFHGQIIYFNRARRRAENFTFCYMFIWNSSWSKLFISRILDEKITVEEVINGISELSNGKSPGEDGILNEMLKSAREVLVPYLVILFNKILDSGQYPERWSDAVLFPLHKKGSVKIVPFHSAWSFGVARVELRGYQITTCIYINYAVLYRFDSKLNPA